MAVSAMNFHVDQFAGFSPGFGGRGNEIAALTSTNRFCAALKTSHDLVCETHHQIQI
jgi:hypothetical protein